MSRTLIFGLGNPYRCDDAAGILAAEQLKARLDRDDIDINCGSLDGLALLSQCSGYDTAIILDAIATGEHPPGTIHTIDPENYIMKRNTGMAHGIDFLTALEMGRGMDLSLPSTILIFAVEIADSAAYSEQCTPAVERGITQMTTLVEQHLGISASGSPVNPGK